MSSEMTGRSAARTSRMSCSATRRDFAPCRKPWTTGIRKDQQLRYAAWGESRCRQRREPASRIGAPRYGTRVTAEQNAEQRGARGKPRDEIVGACPRLADQQQHCGREKKMDAEHQENSGWQSSPQQLHIRGNSCAGQREAQLVPPMPQRCNDQREERRIEDQVCE